ncbi:hypothetical protein R6Q57_024259 [Mikania cordata]
MQQTSIFSLPIAAASQGTIQSLGRVQPALAGSMSQSYVDTIFTHEARARGLLTTMLPMLGLTHRLEKMIDAEWKIRQCCKISPRCRLIARHWADDAISGVPVTSMPLRAVASSPKTKFSTGMWSRSFSSNSGDLVDAVVPFMGESISDGTLATFLKKPGDRVEVDEPIAQIETDKVTIDVASPEAGVIQEVNCNFSRCGKMAGLGDTVEPGTKVAIISKSGEGVTTHVAPSEPPTQPAPAKADTPQTPPPLTPAIQPQKEAPKPPSPKHSASEPQLPPKDRERRVPMTRLRKRVATRLKDSQNTFALLTTFNEVDMTNLMKLRSEYKEAFFEKHGVKLGLMSGFVKAAVSGLQNQPIINAVIDGDDIIYRDYIDISIAVGTPKGLVVPVIRDA